MTDKNIEIGGLNTERLSSIVSRIEHLEEEKKGIQDDIKDIYAEAKGAGFDVKALKHVIKLRKKSQAERDEEDMLFTTYEKALDL